MPSNLGMSGLTRPLISRSTLPTDSSTNNNRWSHNTTTIARSANNTPLSLTAACSLPSWA